nr:hypothetical protein [Bradyrhizobium jicamae]
MLTNRGIADAAVVGFPDDVYGESVVTFVERPAGSPLTIEDVIATAQGRIAGYKKPKHVFLSMTSRETVLARS